MQYSKLAGGFGSQRRAIAGCCCGRFCGSPSDGNTEQSVYMAGQPLTAVGPRLARLRRATTADHMPAQSRTTLASGVARRNRNSWYAYRYLLIPGYTAHWILPPYRYRYYRYSCRAAL